MEDQGATAAPGAALGGCRRHAPEADWVAEASHGEGPPTTNQELMEPRQAGIGSDDGGRSEGGPDDAGRRGDE